MKPPIWRGNYGEQVILTDVERDQKLDLSKAASNPDEETEIQTASTLGHSAEVKAGACLGGSISRPHLAAESSLGLCASERPWLSLHSNLLPAPLLQGRKALSVGKGRG